MPRRRKQKGGKYSKNCHPAIEDVGPKTKCSCLSRAAMNRIVKEIKNSSVSGKVDLFKNYTTKTDCELFKTIQTFYNEESPLKWKNIQDMVKPFYRPKKDKFSNTLYTTQDISQILNQFTKKYRSFQSFGAVPDDFCKYNQEVCKMNLKQLKNAGKSKIAVVFNTDPLHEPGQHWVMLWVRICPTKTIIAYFDSEGHKPSENVQKLINNLTNQDKNATMYNVVEKPHQIGGNQCGIYTVWFVEQLLKGRSIKSLNGHNDTITNKMMTDYSLTNIFPNHPI